MKNELELNKNNKDFEERISKELRKYGIILILLAIITFVFTYKYIFPTGSIILILSGIYAIFRKNINKVIFKK